MEAQSAALRSAVESQGREVAALRATAAAAEAESAAAKAELAQVGSGLSGMGCQRSCFDKKLVLLHGS
jgi:hypothetical protein